MSRLVLLTVFFGASGIAFAHPRARSTLQPPERGAASANQGAILEASVVPLQRLKAPPTFIESHSARVENDLVLLPPALVDVPPAPPTHSPDLLVGTSIKRTSRFFTPAPIADDLEVRREHDRLLLFRDPQPQGAAVGTGLAMFGAATILSAHAPQLFRILFDRRVHLGPAVFGGGGMGAGISGRGL